MIPSFRWFGPGDPVSLAEIRQTGATGIVTALHQIPTGQVWPRDEILKRKHLVESAGLRWLVAESIPVHEDIKKRTGHHLRYTGAYCDSIRNLAAAGVKTVCYNFMPVLDWSRTDLAFTVPDGAICTRFQMVPFAAFDLFILKRPGAASAYHNQVLHEAERYHASLNASERDTLTKTILLGFPGSGEAYTPDALKGAIATYDGIDAGTLHEHLRDFLHAVVPVAEECGVLLGIHPDDPPWPLLGLPRIVSSGNDLHRIMAAVDTPANGITFCTGSLGASAGNDCVALAGTFARRINFLHLRNVRRTGPRDFCEEYHLEGDIDMAGVVGTVLKEHSRRAGEGRGDIPMRPDHGHLMLPDQARKGIYPGYSLFGRMRGLAELRGLERGLSSTAYASSHS